MQTLSIVGDYLSSMASQAKDEEIDLFGRSAFNRYYYAVFLSVRDMLASIDNRWQTQSHAAIPELLRESVVSAITKHAKSAAKNGITGRDAAFRCCHDARNASEQIARLMETARRIRVVADYSREENVSVTQDGCVLSGQSLHAASQWEKRVNVYKGTLIRISKEIALV